MRAQIHPYIRTHHK